MMAVGGKMKEKSLSSSMAPGLPSLSLRLLSSSEKIRLNFYVVF